MRAHTAAENPGVPWPATDALGRQLAAPADVGAVRSDRFVGMFYFLWHNHRDGKSAHWIGPNDVSKVLAADPDALSKPNSPFWGPNGTYHYWAEPQFGYYLTDDPWVIRRHANMLADAGVDVLIFDTTNAVTYREQYFAVCDVFRKIREEGGRTPCITFMVNTNAGRTAKSIYDDLYNPGRYRELWFEWEGKPLMLCDPSDAPPEVAHFFTLRRAHWPFEQVNTSNAWHWEAIYPQVYGYTDDPSKPEQVNVSVAQNLRWSDGLVTNMSDGDGRGRSFHDGQVDRSPMAIQHGHNFREQWNRAHELAPPFVMVTGWNEWIAGRFQRPGKPVVFVDQYDQEYSRDIEPMKGGHADNYYWQLVSNIRRYKGAPALPAPAEAKCISIDGPMDQWKNIAFEFRDHIGETSSRNHDGAGGTHYVNQTGRNDFSVLKVAHDASNLYFYARTREPITLRSGEDWMCLLLDVDSPNSPNWEGYEFIVNRTIGGGGRVAIEASRGDWTWEVVATAAYRTDGNELHIAIPRSAIGIPEGLGGFSIDFKWFDNMQRQGDILDFHESGDAAPDGRFRYRYRAM